jgi:hypothetical protein
MVGTKGKKCGGRYSVQYVTVVVFVLQRVGRWVQLDRN